MSRQQKFHFEIDDEYEPIDDSFLESDQPDLQNRNSRRYRPGSNFKYVQDFVNVIFQRNGSKSQSQKRQRIFIIGAVFLLIFVVIMLSLQGKISQKQIVPDDDSQNKEMFPEDSDNNNIDPGSKVIPPSSSDTTDDIKKRQLCQWRNITLPKSFNPSLYDIYLNIQMSDQFLIKGKENITFIMSDDEEVSCIVLNSYLLNITSAKIDQIQGKVELVQKQQLAIIDLGDYSLSYKKQRKYNISLEFEFYAANTLTGLYKTYFEDSKGKKVVNLVTQFEPIYARQAFPSFDQPDLKAEFKITLEYPKDNRAFANMPTQSAINTSYDTTITTFETTPRVSTYLVAFTVGKYQNLTGYVNSTSTKRETTQISILAPSSRNPSYLEKALDIASKVMVFYENLFQLSYPLPKLDLVSIPDFGAGAMENWGLITFREQYVLYSPANGTQNGLYRLAFVIAHEMAHLWFGDLVTTKDWSQVWLNEGFADFFQYIGGNEAVPELLIESSFYSDSTQLALQFDSSNASHALKNTQNVQSYESFEDNFDFVTYKKGSSILHMLDKYLDHVTQDTNKSSDSDKDSSFNDNTSGDSSNDGGDSSNDGGDSSNDGGDTINDDNDSEDDEKKEDDNEEQQDEDDEEFKKLGDVRKFRKLRQTESSQSIQDIERELISQHYNSTTKPGPTLTGALRKYLREYQYGNVDTKDVWKAIEKYSDKSVNHWMKTWSYQIGYPLVYFTYFQGAVYAQQFQFTNVQIKECDHDHRWWIPIRYLLTNTSTNTSDIDSVWEVSYKLLGKCDKEEITNIDKSGSNSFKANLGQYGYYRSKYDEHLSLWLLNLINDTSKFLGSDDVAGILDDTYQLISLQEDNFQNYFARLYAASLRYNQTSNYLPELSLWKTISKQVSQVGKYLQDETCKSKYISRIQQYVIEPYIKNVQVTSSDSGLGLEEYPTENPLWKIQREIIALLASQFQVGDFDKNSSEILQDDQTLSKYSPDTRYVIYQLAVKGGGEEVFEKIKQIYLSEKEDIARKNAALQALTSSSNSTLIEKVLNFALSDDIKSQDVSTIVSIQASRGAEATHTAFHFVSHNFQTFVDKFGGPNRRAKKAGLQLLASTAQYFTNEHGYETFEKALNEYGDNDDKQAPFVLQALQTISKNIQVSQFLEKNLCSSAILS